MALGYEGWIRLQKNGTADPEYLLGTGGAVPKGRVRLESQSGYGGRIKSPVSETGIAYPRNYDWTAWDGSINFELHKDALDNQVKPWVFDRQERATVKLKTRESNDQEFEYSYWNNISISAGEGAFVDTTIGFVAINRDSYTIGGDYIANKEGDDLFFLSHTPQPLNPGYANTTPIPFWYTTVTINSTQYEFTTWTLDYSQDIVKFFACEHSGGADPGVQEPKFIAAGPMTVTFTGDYMFVDTASFTVPNTLNTLYISIGGTVMKLEDLELTSATDAVQGLTSITPIGVEYAAYTIAA